MSPILNLLSNVGCCCWLLVVGCWLLVVGCWLLVVVVVAVVVVAVVVVAVVVVVVVVVVVGCCCICSSKHHLHSDHRSTTKIIGRERRFGECETFNIGGVISSNTTS